MDKIEPTIKVLHLIDSGGLYGAEKMLLTLCSEQIKQGLQPTILSCGTVNENLKAIELETERLGIPCKAWRMKAGLNVKGMRDIWEWVHKQGFTHLHSHGYKFNILLALTKKCADEVKLVTTVHGYVAPKLFSKMWLNLMLDRHALKHFDSVVFVNKAMLEQPAFKNLKLSNLKVINNGMDFSLFSSGAKCEGDKIVESLPEVGLTIGFIGRLSREKGVDLLLEAFCMLSEKAQSSRLLICGDGPLAEDLKTRAQSSALKGRVVFTGFIKNVESALNKIDVFVMPSLTEGMPMVLMEAMNSNKNIVATDVGGMPEMLDEYTASTLIASNDVGLLKDAIALKMSSTDETASRGCRLSSSYFSATEMAEKYLNVYSSSFCERGRE